MVQTYIDRRRAATASPRDKVARLEEALNAEDTRLEAAEILRSMVDKVVLCPADGGMHAELYGDLAGIIGACEDHKDERPGAGASGRGLSVVAGTRKHLSRTFVLWP